MGQIKTTVKINTMTKTQISYSDCATILTLIYLIQINLVPHDQLYSTNSTHYHQVQTHPLTSAHQAKTYSKQLKIIEPNHFQHQAH